MSQKERRFSFEFFPAKTEAGHEKLLGTARQLAAKKPDFFSCTYGAGGSTRDRTLTTVLQLDGDVQVPTAPHLSCVGDTRAELSALLAHYKDAGIRRIVALRGDLPSGMGFPGDLRYASELIAFIRAEHGDAFRIEVGAYPETHPQASDALTDLRHFKTKIDAGADAAITQYFYNPDAYFHFVDAARKLGVEVPIIPGVMPISNFSQLRRFSEQCGAEIPRWVSKRMQAYGDDAESVRSFGADVVAGLCERLIAGGAPSLHFYTLNLAKPTNAVLERIGKS